MPIRFRRAALAAALLAGLAAGAARAASHDRDTFIREQDLNGDGRVTKEEFQLGRDREFARMDANHDGVISRAEYVGDFKSRLDALLADTPADKREDQRARELRQVEVRFGVLDTDASGGISPAEFAYSGWRMFVHHDTNHDGFVSKDDSVAKDDG